MRGDANMSDSHYGKIKLSFKQKHKDYNELILNIPKHEQKEKEENWFKKIFKNLFRK